MHIPQDVTHYNLINCQRNATDFTNKLHQKVQQVHCNLHYVNLTHSHLDDCSSKKR